MAGDGDRVGARCPLGAVFRLAANVAAPALTGLASVGRVREALPVIVALVVEVAARAVRAALALDGVGAGGLGARRLLANHVAAHAPARAATVAGVRELLAAATLHSLVLAVRALRAAAALHRITARRSGALLRKARHVTAPALALLASVGGVRESLTFSYPATQVLAVTALRAARPLRGVGAGHRRALRSPAHRRPPVAGALTARVVWVGEGLALAVLTAAVHAGAAVLTAASLHGVLTCDRAAHLPLALHGAGDALTLVTLVARVIEYRAARHRLPLVAAVIADGAAVTYGRVATPDRGTRLGLASHLP